MMLLRRLRSALDLDSTAESRNMSARLWPLFGVLVSVAALAPLLCQRIGVPTWAILAIQGLATLGLLGLLVAMIRSRSHPR